MNFMNMKLAKLSWLAFLVATGLNANRISAAETNDLPATIADGDFTLGPDYTNAPEVAVRAGVPQGAVYHFTMNSADSRIYPGLTGDYTRDVYVYVPRQYVVGTPAPFIVVQDGRSY